MSPESTKPLRIIFMGSAEFSVPSLKVLASSVHQILAVVTGTDKKRGRGNELTPTIVKSTAIDLGLPVLEADDVKTTAFDVAIRSLKPDLLVVVAFKVLPKNILMIPKIGSINLHASLLPKYRGAAPIHWAVMNGETETGVTVFFLDDKVDTGNCLLQAKIRIEPDETTGDVYHKLMNIGAEKLLESVEMIATGEFQLHKQDDAKVSKAPKLFSEDGEIRFEKDAVTVYNHIRGMNPFPSAYCLIDGKKLKVYKSKIVETDRVLRNLSVGQLDKQKSSFIVGCGKGAIELLEVQLEGKKRTDGESFLRGYMGKLQIGE
jgi:methionyl-tRNA formyltransferase